MVQKIRASRQVLGDSVTPTNLQDTAVTPSTYGSPTQVPVLTLDSDGRVTNAVNTTIAGVAPADGDKGDLTVSASGATWTIDNDVVTYAKLQNISAASKLLGRGSASGAGDTQEITLGTNLSMSGTTLNAAGGAGTFPQEATIWVDQMTTIMGVWGAIALPSQRYLFAWQNSSHANGDELQYPLFMAAGTYTIYFFCATTNDAPLVDVEIDGTPVVTGVDFYSVTATVYNVVLSASITIPADGNVTLGLKINGKNGSSSNYYLTLNKLWIK